MSDTDRTERRLARLERELHFWRIAGLLIAGLAIGASCHAPSEELSALDLVSADGEHHVHLGPEGLTIVAGEHTATYSETLIALGAGSSIRLGDHETGLQMAPDGLILEAPEGALGSVRADGVRVARGGTNVRMAVESGDSAVVVTTSEHASATLGATDGESSMTLRGPGEPQVMALVQAAASVTVAGESGSVHVYGSGE